MEFHLQTHGSFLESRRPRHERPPHAANTSQGGGTFHADYRTTHHTTNRSLHAVEQFLYIGSTIKTIVLPLFRPIKFSTKFDTIKTGLSGADPGFLKRGFICINEWGFCFADLISFFLNIPRKWNNLVSLRPNYYNFIGYLKMPSGSPSGWSIIYSQTCSIDHLY